MVRVKNIIADDVYGQWHIEKIVVQKDGQRYAIIPDKQAFSTKDDAEYYAHIRARRFVERQLGQNNSNRRAALKFVFTTTFISVVTALVVQWWRDQRIALATP